MSEFSVGSWELLKVVLNDFAPVPTPPPKRHLAMFGNFCCCNSEWVVLVIQ